MSSKVLKNGLYRRGIQQHYYIHTVYCVFDMFAYILSNYILRFYNSTCRSVACNKKIIWRFEVAKAPGAVEES